jgi:hypothetical protein
MRTEITKNPSPVIQDMRNARSQTLTKLSMS